MPIRSVITLKSTQIIGSIQRQSPSCVVYCRLWLLHPVKIQTAMTVDDVDDDVF